MGATPSKQAFTAQRTREIIAEIERKQTPLTSAEIMYGISIEFRELSGCTFHSTCYMLAKKGVLVRYSGRRNQRTLFGLPGKAKPDPTNRPRQKGDPYGGRQ